MRRDFCKLCTAAEGQSWVFRRMLISTCGETTRGWQRTIWKDLPYQCPTFTYGWTQPILTSQTRKLKLHRAFSWIVRKVLPQRYEKISPRLSLVLRSPEMSEKQEPKESNCFHITQLCPRTMINIIYKKRETRNNVKGLLNFTVPQFYQKVIVNNFELGFILGCSAFSPA